MKHRFLFVIFTFCLISDVIFAYDFKSTYKSHVIYYNILKNDPQTVEVTYCEISQPTYRDSLEIPENVENNGIIYKVTTLGSSCFNGCNKLIYVKLPPSVHYIELLAFRDNINLQYVDITSTILKADGQIITNNPIYNRTEKYIYNQTSPYGTAEVYGKVNKYSYYSDLAIAVKNDKYGIIDRKGDVILPFIYDNISDIACIYCKYKYTCPSSSFVAIANKNGKWGIVDANGSEFYPFKETTSYQTMGKIKSITRKINKNNSKHVYDVVYNKIKSAALETRLRLNMQLVNDSIDNIPIPKKYDALWGFASKNNPQIWVVNPIYNSCHEFNKTHRFLVSQNNEYGLLNSDAKTWLIECNYTMDMIHNYPFLFNDGKYILLMPDGHFVSRTYDNIIYACSTNDNSIYYTISNNKWGLFSPEKEIVVDCIFDAIGEFHDGVADTYYGKYKGSIDINGKEVNSIVKEMYDEACGMSDSNFSDKLALYNAIIRMDNFSDEGYAAGCYNNIGVMYFNAGNYTSAIAYFETAIKNDPNTGLYTKNLKSAKSNMRLNRLTKVLNIISGSLNNMAAIQNSHSNSSDNINTNVTGEPHANTGNYEVRYRIWKNAAESQSNSLNNALKRPVEGSNLLLIQTLKRNLQKAQQHMAQIRSEAASHGITIQE